MHLHGLQAKILGIVVGVLTPLFALTTWFMVAQVNDTLGAQAATMARDQSQAIADALQTFGKIGEMDGLEGFLTRLTESSPDLRVRAVRAPVTTKEYGARKSSPEPDALELDVIASGKTREERRPDEHLTRYVVPIVNHKDCLECHSAAPEGAVLGTSSVELRTDAADAAQSRLGWTIAGLLAATLLIAVLLLAVALTRIAIRPIRRLKHAADRLAEGDIAGAEQVIDGHRPPTTRIPPAA